MCTDSNQATDIKGETMDKTVWLIIALIELALLVLIIVSLWKVFNKAGRPGWAVLIPFYNIYVMLRVAGKPGWWLILLLIPIVNIVFGIITVAGISHNFGKSVKFTLGLIFLPIVFYPILAFGSAKYVNNQPGIQVGE